MDWLNTIDSILNSPVAGNLLGGSKKSPTPVPATPAPVITVQNPTVSSTPWGLIAGGVGAVVLILVLLLKKK